MRNIVLVMALHEFLFLLFTVRTFQDAGKERKGNLHARDIDAHWIQRSLSKFYKDPIVAQQKVKEVLQVLKVLSTGLVISV